MSLRVAVNHQGWLRVPPFEVITAILLPEPKKEK